ncbi:MAG: potassium transporter TrkA, partial [Treponema sp.]|nr:potassium transporter TrkA [Treponema sp.]
IAGTPISQFRLPAGGLVMLANRDGRSFIPRGDYIFNRGDHVVLISKSGNETEIDKLFGSRT